MDGGRERAIVDFTGGRLGKRPDLLEDFKSSNHGSNEATKLKLRDAAFGMEETRSSMIESFNPSPFPRIGTSSLIFSKEECVM